MCSHYKPKTSGTQKVGPSSVQKLTIFASDLGSAYAGIYAEVSNF